MTPSFKHQVLPAAALFVLVVALYAPSIRFDFIYDDGVLILEQPVPQTPGDVFGVFLERHFPNLPYYRPVARFTMVVQKFLHGDHPGPYHLFNALLMGMTAIVVYSLLRLPVFAVRPPLALLGAALFAAHPIASSCVYPICSGRETLLPAVFILAATYAFLRSGLGWYVTAMLLFAVSLLCKEQAAIVPLIFVMIDALGLSPHPPGRSMTRWAARYLPVVVILALYFLIRWQLFGGEGAHRVAVIERPLGPLLTGLYALQTILVPFVGLAYEPRVEVWFCIGRQLVVLIIVAILAIGAYHRWRDLGCIILFWLGWMVLSLLPTANLLDQEARFDERYILLALVGAVGIVAALASKAWDGLRARQAIGAVAVVLVIACAAISFGRGRWFQNDLVFLTQWRDSDPEAVQAHASLADMYIRQEKFEEAEPYARQALTFTPGLAEQEMNLGIIEGRRGNLSAAEAHLRRAVDLKPEFADAHRNLGLALLKQNKLDEAGQRLEESLRLKPDQPEAHYSLGVVRFNQQQHPQAAAHFERAVNLRPDYAEALRFLGVTLSTQGKLNEAAAQLARAITLQPDFVEAHYDLAVVYYNGGDPRRAAEQLEQVLRLKPDFTQARENLNQIRTELQQRGGK